MNPLWLAVAGLSAAVALPFAFLELAHRRQRRSEKARSFRRKEKIRLVRGEAPAKAEAEA
jgi:hypothetical protein